MTFAGQIIETGTLSNASRRLAAARRARSLTDDRAELLQDTRVLIAIEHERPDAGEDRTLVEGLVVVLITEVAPHDRVVAHLDGRRHGTAPKITTFGTDIHGSPAIKLRRNSFAQQAIEVFQGDAGRPVGNQDRHVVISRVVIAEERSETSPSRSPSTTNSMKWLQFFGHCRHMSRAPTRASYSCRQASQVKQRYEGEIEDMSRGFIAPVATGASKPSCLTGLPMPPNGIMNLPRKTRPRLCGQLSG